MSDRKRGDWQPFCCGDMVSLKEDPRHVGRVSAVVSGLIRVRWEETNWISDENPNDLIKSRGE